MKEVLFECLRNLQMGEVKIYERFGVSVLGFGEKRVREGAQKRSILESLTSKFTTEVFPKGKIMKKEENEGTWRGAGAGAKSGAGAQKKLVTKIFRRRRRRRSPANM